MSSREHAHNAAASPAQRGGAGSLSFQEAVDFLEKAVNYEKRTRVKYTDRNFDLGRMEALLARLGNPHRTYRIIHVAGTKGKGTTAAVLASCLRCAGYRTGLHTSPHLVSVCERMMVDGAPATEEEFCLLLEQVRDYIDRKRRQSRNDAPTYFETTTALAFKHFQQRKVHWGVVEVGLGGRLDSTNVVLPECCVVTPIGLDHTDKLGATVDKIAAEKAGIFKRDVPVVIARQDYQEALEVLRRRAEMLGCRSWEVGREVKLIRMRPLRAPRVDPEAPVGDATRWRTVPRPSAAWTCSRRQASSASRPRQCKGASRPAAGRHGWSCCSAGPCSSSTRRTPWSPSGRCWRRWRCTSPAVR